MEKYQVTYLIDKVSKKPTVQFKCTLAHNICIVNMPKGLRLVNPTLIF